MRPIANIRTICHLAYDHSFGWVFVYGCQTMILSGHPEFFPSREAAVRAAETKKLVVDEYGNVRAK